MEAALKEELQVTIALPAELADDRGIGAHEQLATGELAEKIAQLISSLPPRQREVLVLSAYEKLEPIQIAGLLGISEANDYSTLHVARARLKSQLAPYFVEK